MGKQILTKEKIEQLYQLAKRVHFKKKSMASAKDDAQFLYGINPRTAEGYCRNLSLLLAGEKYIRTMNEQATRYFLDNIKIDFGQAAFTASLEAIRKHQNYYENKSSKQRYIDRILNDYQ
ncbi:MAG: hypothetical protein IJN42_06775 [Clostridia bacterium]|nr:hypothetical protein [Clostridia bacterium]